MVTLIVGVVCLAAGFGGGYYVKKVGAQSALASIQAAGGKLEDLAKRL